MADYSIDRLLKIYENLELDLIKQMTLHIKEMEADGVRKSEIERWKKSQMSGIAKFKRESRFIISKYKKVVKEETEKTLIEIYQDSQKKELKRLIRNYGKTEKFKKALSGIDLSQLNAINDRRMVALLNAVNHDTEKAFSSIYRKINDEYRKIIHDAAIEFNTGNHTLWESVSIAEKDFLKNGITSIIYASGAHVNIRSYAEMALRTNGHRATIQGEAMLRDYLEIYTVKVSSHGITCEKCAEWQGQILIDDIYQSGKPDGKYQLLSTAMHSGLLHPNCRHSLITIDPEIDGDESTPYTYTAKDAEKYQAQQKQRRLEREMRELKRYRAGAVTPADKAKYQKLINKKSNQIDKFVDDNDFLIRQREREQI